jgi:hypothetical protein
MKRIRLLVLLGMVAVALPVGLLQGVAKAKRPTGGTTSTTETEVSIRQYADFNLNGLQLDVGLNVRCTGGLGLATVSVTQTTPDSPHPVTGGGTKDVVCDGQTHSVGVSVVGVLYDAGKAYATADVTSDSGGTAHAERWITVQVV